jgi:hypothetical protein
MVAAARVALTGAGFLFWDSDARLRPARLDKVLNNSARRCAGGAIHFYPPRLAEQARKVSGLRDPAHPPAATC